MGHGVEGLGALDFKHRADLQVVLQIGTHAGQIMLHFDVMRMQQGAGADARELQELRRGHCPCGQHHFARGARHQRRVAPQRQHFHTHRAQRLTSAFKQHTRGVGTCPHLQILAPHHGAQEGFGSVPAPARALVHFKVADTCVVASVEVVSGGNAGLLRGR